jgi:hypothetical protein
MMATLPVMFDEGFDVVGIEIWFAVADWLEIHKGWK